jgi:hypothetical protein
MKLRPLQGSFLSANFYYGALPEPEALLRLVRALLNLGATLTGEGYAHRGSGIRALPFRGRADLLPEPVPVRNIHELSQLLDNPDLRVVEVLFQNALSNNPRLAEVVSFEMIWSESALKDRHPVSIDTEGWLFDGPMRQSHPKRARGLGRHVYRRFTALVAATRPIYGSITGETWMQCILDLHAEPKSAAFDDFYISEYAIGASGLKAIPDLYPGAFIEPLADGLYVSCMADFNPEEREPKYDPIRHPSLQLVKLIIKHCPKPPMPPELKVH